MPITVCVAKHNANKWPHQSRPRSGPFKSAELLKYLNDKESEEIGEILVTVSGQQTSLNDRRLEEITINVQNHGLVHGALKAYNDHHHLVLRPEDIWFAILVQFSFYVNAHSEELRSSFVAHSGKKGLIVRDPDQPDMGLMCRNMTKLIEKNIVDPKLREWILPNFTTTTMHDEVVASIIMMGTLQKYFEYVFDCTSCGVPMVTLLGKLSDWQKIRTRIEKLTEYGEEPTLFCDGLRPIMDNFIATFTSSPGDTAIVEFWDRMINHESGSGMDHLTGWMVAFCFWGEDGKRIGKKGHSYKNGKPEIIDVIEFAEVPAGFVSVPVTYIDPGSNAYPSKLLAGFAGYQVTMAVNLEHGIGAQHGMSLRLDTMLKKLRLRSSNTQKDSTIASPDAEHDVLNTIQPLTAWWMYTLAVTKGPQSRSDYYTERMRGVWNGQASTGTILPGGSMVVKDGLPHDVEVFNGAT